MRVTARTADSGRKTSIRDPNFMIPNRWPRATSTPGERRQTTRRASTPTTCRKTTVWPPCSRRTSLRSFCGSGTLGRRPAGNAPAAELHLQHPPPDRGPVDVYVERRQEDADLLPSSPPAPRPASAGPACRTRPSAGASTASTPASAGSRRSGSRKKNANPAAISHEERARQPETPSSQEKQRARRRPPPATNGMPARSILHASCTSRTSRRRRVCRRSVPTERATRCSGCCAGSRLATSAPPRSRCYAGFDHGLLAIEEGLAVSATRGVRWRRSMCSMRSLMCSFFFLSVASSNCSAPDRYGTIEQLGETALQLPMLLGQITVLVVFLQQHLARVLLLCHVPSWLGLPFSGSDEPHGGTRQPHGITRHNACFKPVSGASLRERSTASGRRT